MPYDAHTEVTEIDNVGQTAEEQHVLLTSRWWTVEELAVTHDVVAPRKMALLLPPLLAGRIPTTPIDVGE